MNIGGKRSHTRGGQTAQPTSSCFWLELCATDLERVVHAVTWSYELVVISELQIVVEANSRYDIGNAQDRAWEEVRVEFGKTGAVSGSLCSTHKRFI